MAKRSQRNKQKHQLEDYEVVRQVLEKVGLLTVDSNPPLRSPFSFQEAYNNLRKILTSKWDFVMMQAEEQVLRKLQKAVLLQKFLKTRRFYASRL